MPISTIQRLERVARQRFGYKSLRPGQQEAMESVVAGRDTLVVMPTGSGKSAIYQIPAVLVPGPTVVVSPLIALQKDQVESLQRQDVGGAEVVNSTVSDEAKDEVFDDLEDGDLEFVFLTPEQLSDPEVLGRLQESKPSLFVVDEAHCISEWGHDFRPDYLKLGAVIEALDHPTVLALTATAAPDVRQEIIERLSMRDPHVMVRGFDRPNIWLGVQVFGNETQKREALFELIASSEKPGIVYASSRRHAEEVASLLAQRGLKAVYYHGGMTSKQRGPVQEDFMAGEADVIVATSAFGMGVDKPNVRFVYHYDVPNSLDSYYQEIGRAGRDGAPSKAVLLYKFGDLNIHKFFAGGGRVDEEKIERVVEIVRSENGPISTEELLEKTDLSKSKVHKAVQRLEEVGAVETLPTGEIVAAEREIDVNEAARLAAEEDRKRHEAELARLERMRAYAEMRDCRRQYLMHYFGEEFAAPCGACDRCASGS